MGYRPLYLATVHAAERLDRSDHDPTEDKDSNGQPDLSKNLYSGRIKAERMDVFDGAGVFGGHPVHWICSIQSTCSHAARNLVRA